MRLKDKVAVITGGTRGLGRAVAERFLHEGASVVCAARRPYDIDELVRRHPGRVRYEHTDVTDAQSLVALTATTVDTWGRLDVMVANAGINRDGKVERLPSADWDAMVATNLTGVFHAVQAAATHMVKQGGGRIITVSSSMSTRVAVGAAGYSATKSAVETLTRVAAIELGPKGVQVNCLAPGVLEDGMGREVAGNPKVWEAYRKRFSLGRPGTLDEAAQAAVFLAGDESSYVNGHILEVNGGLLWA